MKLKRWRSERKFLLTLFRDILISDLTVKDLIHNDWMVNDLII
jgi:hypothetical protein